MRLCRHNNKQPQKNRDASSHSSGESQAADTMRIEVSKCGKSQFILKTTKK